MARALRIEYEGAFYHVTSRGNERKKIFFSKSDYQRFKSYLESAIDKYEYRLHAYILMGNHYHLLIETGKANLNKLMHYINGSYTNYINRRKDRSGHLFQGRYKAILIDRDNYLLELSRYIHLNPVRAGIVERPQDYPFSSYSSFIKRKGEKIVYRDLIWAMMSKKVTEAPKKYRDFVENALADGQESPLKNVYGGSILGNKSFIKESLGRINDSLLRRNDVSYRRDLRSSIEAKDIMAILSEHFGVSTDDLIRARGDLRNATIYFIKKYTEMTNCQIGELFGDLSYSAISQVQRRLLNKVSKDKSLRKELEKIDKTMSHVKG